MHTIKDFENFVYGTNNILDNAQFDIIEWQEHFSKELWEKNSFLANGIMKTARRVWREDGSKINNFAHCSKTNIKHLIYVENNVIVIQFLRSEIEKIAERVTKFKDDYKMFHVDIMPKNHWFLDLWGLIFGYKEWFDELIEPLQKNIAPQLIEPILKKGSSEIPENPYPLIFKNGYAYLMFLDLKALTVKDRTVVADYSFIFHKMKNKTIKAINAVVTEPAFINFLNEQFKTDISINKLPIRNPNSKQLLYNTTLDKYKAGILE